MRIGAKNNFCQTAAGGSRVKNRAIMTNCESCVPDAARPSISGKGSVNDWHERRVGHQELKNDPEWQTSEKGCREASPRSGFRKT
jgi:2-keto-4-pentenoate hydratase/2-oxohepta-3-ene-1,7-dioic acid hydratase in catechol pathway